MKKLFILLFLFITLGTNAQNNKVSGLNARQFHKYWKVESESPDYKVTFQGDTAEILSPKGLTLWRKEKMSGRVTIEYDACVVVEKEGDRLSDLNCFWMASDPKHPDNIWKREKWRSGIFLNCYSLQLYYMGYGGNYNSTTRFRRYDGNEAGITDPKVRPAILKEYTDTEHLLKANHWYHIKITNENNRVSYYIDGKRLVDFRDAEPLTEGWFGFRTTLSRTRITNFRYECLPPQTSTVPLHWIGNTPEQDKAVSFGVPFDEGYLFPETSLRLKTDRNQEIPVDTWPLAYWPDGSVKWSGVAGVIPAGTERLTLEKAPRKAKIINKQPNASIAITETPENIQIETGLISVFIPRHGDFLIDSLLYKGTKVGEKARLICNTKNEPIQENTSQISFTHYIGEIKSVTIERLGSVRALVKLEGIHRNRNKEIDTNHSEGKGNYANNSDMNKLNNREWLPFVVRLYFYGGSEQIKMVHSFVYDGDQKKDFIRSLGIRFDVPMREALYNRHIAFSCADGGVCEPVQPLVGRRILTLNKTDIKKNSNEKKDAQQKPTDEPSLQQQQMEGYVRPQNAVMLTLAFGKKIAVDEQQLEESLTTDAVTIRRDSIGGLVYEVSGQKNRAAERFNILEVPVAAEYQLRLSDGTVVYLNSDSCLKYPEVFTGNERKVYLEGEAYFEVAKDKEHPFKVMAQGVEVNVLGTHFNVNAYPERTDVVTTLVEGKVRVGRGTRQIVLVPGEQAAASAESLNVKKVDVREYIAWKDGLFVFSRMSLEEIMRQVYRWYGVETVFSDETVRAVTFTGVIDKSMPLEELFKVIETVVDVRFVMDENNQVVITAK